MRATETLDKGAGRRWDVRTLSSKNRTRWWRKAVERAGEWGGDGERRGEHMPGDDSRHKDTGIEGGLEVLGNLTGVGQSGARAARAVKKRGEEVVRLRVSGWNWGWGFRERKESVPKRKKKDGRTGDKMRGGASGGDLRKASQPCGEMLKGNWSVRRELVNFLGGQSASGEGREHGQWR